MRRASDIVHVRLGCFLISSQHLDEEGQSRVLGVLRNLKQSTVLLVSQANSSEAWDATAVDWVVKAEDCSTVQCASDSFISTGAFT